MVIFYKKVVFFQTLVSDTSPISGLILIGELDLLRKVFEKIIIPQKVYDEIIVFVKRSDTNIDEFRNENWIEVKKPKNLEFVNDLMSNLEAGESEAIALAKELKARFILIDEKRGRKIASELGFTVIGLIGILIKAKEARLITNVKTYMDKLRYKAGFWINEDLYKKVLLLVNE